MGTARKAVFLGGFVFDYQFPPESVEGAFDLSNVGSVVGVHELADGCLRDAESVPQRHIGHAQTCPLCGANDFLKVPSGHDFGKLPPA